jgi:hypothetical protein
MDSKISTWQTKQANKQTTFLHTWALMAPTTTSFFPMVSSRNKRFYLNFFCVPNVFLKTFLIAPHFLSHIVWPWFNFHVYNI